MTTFFLWKLCLTTLLECACFRKSWHKNMCASIQRHERREARDAHLAVDPVVRQPNHRPRGPGNPHGHMWGASLQQGSGVRTSSSGDRCWQVTWRSERRRSETCITDGDATIVYIYVSVHSKTESPVRGSATEVVFTGSTRQDFNGVIFVNGPRGGWF